MLYTGQIRKRQSLLEEYQAPLGDVLAATVEETLVRSPLASGNRAEELFGAQYGERSSLLEILTGKGIVQEPDSPVVPPDEARQRVKQEGVDLSIPDDGIRARALDILIERKKDEVRRQDILNRAAPGFANATARVATALGASMFDPINIGVAFVPVVGPARYAQMVARAGSTLGRAVVRARIGLIEGAVGTALAEPIVYSAASQEQADYDAFDSLTNIALGTALGGGLHVGAGAVADAVARGVSWRQARAQEPLPRLLEEMPSQAREAALRTAVAQAATGRQVDVAPILALNARGLRSSTAIARVADFESTPFGRLVEATEAVSEAPEVSRVPGLTGRGEIRLHETREAAESALRNVERLRGDRDWQVTETVDGRFALTRPMKAEVVRDRAGAPRVFATRRQAERASRDVVALRDRALDVAPFAEGDRTGFVLVEGATPEDLRAIGQAPELVRWTAPEGEKLDARVNQARFQETLRTIQERARQSFLPQQKRLVDFEASRAADRQLREAANDETMPDVTLTEAMESVQETATVLGFEDMVSRELAEFDELQQTAESYGRAVRAAADCGLRRGAA